MTTNDNKVKQKLSNKFYCPDCDYGTCRKSNFDTHLLSNKHQTCVLTTDNNGIKQKLSKNHNCPNCDKEFNDRAGLWRHKKKCANEDQSGEVYNETQYSIHDKDNLILMLIKQNAELIKESTDLKHLMIGTQSQMLEVIKNGTHNTTNNTTNSHNKAFNLNFFLNETCKDAMNIMDFVDSIKLQLSDLEKVGELGYVEGISNIIVKNLNELDVTQRPVHCTDKKRETMYIKDEDKWEKDESNSKIKKAIKRVASKNQRLLPKFKEAHPDCGTYHSKYSDQYNKIIIESVGGSGDNDAEKEEKIIRNISKNVVVDK
jgi:predicted RNA-binding Zn-ribbon protein involved in translation (DUF1610 family)